jgi:hypothetical protein
VNDERTQIITVARRTDTGPAERLRCLELVDGADMGRRHLVGASGVTIGRVAPADIVLADTEVSRSHCRVTLVGDDLVVTDLNSTNGTLVDGVRVAQSAIVPVGGLITVGRQTFKHEWLTGKQFQKSDELDRDLATANAYIQALLPPPVPQGPIRADWIYQPCAKLGGDAFGYTRLGPTQFAAYLIDVSGHGAGAAMHSVAVMNLLRQQALPGTDMLAPGEVLSTLNAMFQMEHHANMYFTMWYGVFDTVSRRLEFASAGHHPAYLVPADRSEAIPMQTRSSLVGAIPGKTYASDSLIVPPGASVYLFSDGVFEIVTNDGVQWALADFLPLILQPPVEGASESERLFRSVKDMTPSGEFDDDFSLVVLAFD